MSDFPALLNLEIDRDRDFRQEFLYEDEDETAINMTGWTIEAEIRATKATDGTLIATFVAEETDLTNGSFAITLTDTVTGAITAEDGYWDLKITNASGLIEKFAYGRVEFKNSVTA